MTPLRNLPLIVCNDKKVFPPKRPDWFWGLSSLLFGSYRRPCPGSKAVKLRSRTHYMWLHNHYQEWLKVHHHSVICLRDVVPNQAKGQCIFFYFYLPYFELFSHPQLEDVPYQSGFGVGTEISDSFEWHRIWLFRLQNEWNLDWYVGTEKLGDYCY